MTLAQLEASRALWRGRAAYRKAKRDFYRLRSARPWSERKPLIEKWANLFVAAQRTVERRDEQIGELRSWGGSRAIIEEIIDIVGDRAPVGSRKRNETYGNPGSDHHVSQKNADAVDFRIAEAHWLKNEISRRMGGPEQLADYDSFLVYRPHGVYRVQCIAATHGTGPHLHVGVRKV